MNDRHFHTLSSLNGDHCFDFTKNPSNDNFSSGTACTPVDEDLKINCCPIYKVLYRLVTFLQPSVTTTWFLEDPNTSLRVIKQDASALIKCVFNYVRLSVVTNSQLLSSELSFCSIKARDLGSDWAISSLVQTRNILAVTNKSE